MQQTSNVNVTDMKDNALTGKLISGDVKLTSSFDEDEDTPATGAAVTNHSTCTASTQCDTKTEGYI